MSNEKINDNAQQPESKGFVGKIREFAISTAAINNKTSVFVLTFLILLMGINSYNSMPKESFPEITQPQIYVSTVYPGNSPVDIENLITCPIEKEINTINGLDQISSTSAQGYSAITVDFSLDTDVKEALQEVKDAVDRAKADLPSDLDNDPEIFELDFSEMPIMFVNLYGEMDFESMRRYAEYLEDEIEKVNGISAVDVKGVLDREVQINVDPEKMAVREISFNDIAGAIAQENVTMSGGDLLTDGFRRNIRMVGEYSDVSEIKDIIVKNENAPVYLRDVADVRFDYVEPTSYARLDGDPVITLEVKKQSGENLLDAADDITEILEDAKENVLPSELNVIVTNDQSKQTRDMVESLENNIISGVILVVLVLLFFLGLRNAAFVGIAIPLSMLMGIAILNFSGTTLNMMVLFSLILALGMLVDNGIVVVENVYRLLDEGRTNERSAKEGVGEVAWPIIASTATTLAAFLPLLFWNDLMGEFMKYLPITLMIVLSSSLFVALVVNPVLTAVFMKIDSGEPQRSSRGFWILVAVSAVLSALSYLGGNNTWGSIFGLVATVALLNRFVLVPASRFFQSRILPVLERFYHSVISFALSGRKPVLFLTGTFILLIGSCFNFAANPPAVLFFPENQPLYVNVFIEMPIGTDIAETNKFALKVEEKIDNMLRTSTDEKTGRKFQDVVEALTSSVGEGTADPNEGVSMGSSPNKARVNVSFVEYKYRKGVNTSEIMRQINETVERMPGATITIGKDPVGPPTGYAINVEVLGENVEDIEELILIADDLRKHMVKANIDGIDELKLDLETGKPQLLVNVDRDAARRFGLSSMNVIMTINNALYGNEVSKYKEGEDDYPIMVRFDKDHRYDLSALMNQPITFQDNRGNISQVPISAVASLEYSSTYGSIKRKDMDRVISIFSNVEEGANPTAIVTEMKSYLDGYLLPDGYTYKFTGEQEEQAESFSFLLFAMGMAVGLIILIIVTQFNSIFVPLIIMLTVAFSIIGVLLGITFTGMDFVILMMMIGIISLAGIVVNNAIVLIDYINLLRERKREELGIGPDAPLERQYVIETIVKAGETRLRPVLLTAITTILGLIPLAIGININFATLLSDFDPQFYLGGDSVAFWKPMAWTVIYGLAFATFLTLVIVPVMYFIIDRAKARVGKLFRKISGDREPQVAA